MGAKVSARPPVPPRWDASQMPSQSGKVAVVTGANSGIGYETALQLARKGAHVVLACRSESRGKHAAYELKQQLAIENATGSVEFMQLDLSDLSSVQTFSDTFKRAHDRLDLLVNNAGVMGGSYELSADGYERQFATNHLGHFALTAQLFEVIKKSAPARIVNVSSFLHRQAGLTFNEDKVMAPDKKSYAQWSNYTHTKLYNILFTMELHRRVRAKGMEGIAVVACHPGYTASNLVTAPGASNSSLFWKLFFKLAKILPQQSTQMGALPTLYAATGEAVVSGDFFGPEGLGTIFGYPRLETPSKLSQSTTAAWKLWESSEKLAQMEFSV